MINFLDYFVYLIKSLKGLDDNQDISVERGIMDYFNDDEIMTHLYRLYEQNKPYELSLQLFLDGYMFNFSEHIREENAIKELLKSFGTDVNNLEPGQLSKMTDFKVFIPALEKSTGDTQGRLLNYFLAKWPASKIASEVFNALYPLVLANPTMTYANQVRLLLKIIPLDGSAKIGMVAFDKILSFVPTGHSYDLLERLLININETAIEQTSANKIFNSIKGRLNPVDGPKESTQVLLAFLSKIGLEKLASENLEQFYSLLLKLPPKNFREICFSSKTFEKDEDKKIILNKLFASISKGSKMEGSDFEKSFLLIATLKDEENKSFFLKKLLEKLDPSIITWENFNRIFARIEELGDEKTRKDLLVNLLVTANPDRKIKRILDKINGSISRFENNENKIDLLLAGVAKFKPGKMGVLQLKLFLNQLGHVASFKKEQAPKKNQFTPTILAKLIGFFLMLYQSLFAKKEQELILLEKLFEKINLQEVANSPEASAELTKIAATYPSLKRQKSILNSLQPKTATVSSNPAILQTLNRKQKATVAVMEPAPNLAKSLGAYNQTTKQLKPVTYKESELATFEIGGSPWLGISPKTSLDPSTKNKNKILTVIDYAALEKTPEKKQQVMELVMEYVNQAYEDKIAVDAKVSLQLIDDDPALKKLYHDKLPPEQGDQISFLLYLNDNTSKDEMEKIATWFLKFKQALEDHGIPLAKIGLGNDRLWEQGYFIMRDDQEISGDMRFYAGTKTEIYRGNSNDSGRLNHDLHKIQTACWGSNRNEAKVKQAINSYYEDLRSQGHYNGKTEWAKCDLDLVDNLLSSTWKPNEAIDPEFFSMVKETFAYRQELLHEELIDLTNRSIFK